MLEKIDFYTEVKEIIGLYFEKMINNKVKYNEGSGYRLNDILKGTNHEGITKVNIDPVISELQENNIIEVKTGEKEIVFNLNKDYWKRLEKYI